MGCTSLPDTYLTIGTGLKINETNVYFDENKFTDPISARIQLEFQISESLSIGYNHRSQWFSGAPFNSESEYNLDELFIDYRFKLK